MSFEYETAPQDPTIERGSMALAGGTDLLSLHKVGLIDTQRVVDLKTSGLPDGIEPTVDGWRLGALATLSDLEDHDDLRDALRAITAAVAQAATRQIRNRATVGGNLLQRPRCRYYRDEATTCWFDGGDSCPAREGRNEHHAIFDTGPCVAVQPSDLASVLVALDADVTTHGPRARTIPVADLLAAPTDDRRALHRLGGDEIISSIEIAVPDGRRSSYRKAMDRAAWQFALAGVAAAVDTDGDGVVTRARLVASGVAGTPWRLHHAEDSLAGRVLSPESIADAGRCADEGAKPLEHNGYKRALLRGLVRRTLEDLESGS